MAKKKQEFQSVSAIMRELSANLTQVATKPNVLSYIPNPRQVEFHSCDKYGRIYAGGNRAGKTVGSAVEAIYWLTDTHPYLETPKPPVHGRVCAVDFVNGVDVIILPTLKQWLPASYLINGSWDESYNNDERVLTLNNGSTLQFKSYDQDLDKHAGVALNFVWFDEEPPHSIWIENLARLTSTDGRWWIAMTPVENMTWTYETIYEPASKGEKEMQLIQARTTDNTTIEQSAVSKFTALLSEEDRMAREEGRFVPSGGLIFPSYDYEKVVFTKFPFHIRHPDVRIVTSVDAGINHWMVWLYHAITPAGKVYTFHEIATQNASIPQICHEIRKFERKLGVFDVYLRCGDPAMKQRSVQTGYSDQVAFAQEGYDIMMANNSYDTIRKMQWALENGQWFIHESCTLTHSQMRKYRWADWDTRKQRDNKDKKQVPHKKNDDAMDSARYMFASLPELGLAQDMIKSIQKDKLSLKSKLNATEAIDPETTPVDHFMRLEREGKSRQRAYQYYDETIGYLE